MNNNHYHYSTFFSKQNDEFNSNSKISIRLISLTLSLHKAYLATSVASCAKKNPRVPFNNFSFLSLGLIAKLNKEPNGS